MKKTFADLQASLHNVTNSPVVERFYMEKITTKLALHRIVPWGVKITQKKAPVLWLERTEIWPLLGPGTPKIFENLKLLKIWHIILRSKGFFIANTNIDILFIKNQFLEFYDVIKVISKIMKFKNWSKVGNIIVHSTWFFIAIIIKNV